jgi:hypothetical protein
MQRAKFNGLIAKVLERYPNVDVEAFVEEKLKLPQLRLRCWLNGLKGNTAQNSLPLNPTAISL